MAEIGPGAVFAAMLRRMQTVGFDKLLTGGAHWPDIPENVRAIRPALALMDPSETPEVRTNKRFGDTIAFDAHLVADEYSDLDNPEGTGLVNVFKALFRDASFTLGPGTEEVVVLLAGTNRYFQYDEYFEAVIPYQAKVTRPRSN